MLKRIDSLKHVGLRKRMTEQIKSLGYNNLRLLSAFINVPRHLFMDVTLEEMAYQDKALPIGQDQTISAPSMVALQTSLLDPQPGEKILEIGTGSGYQAAILIDMGVKLYSIERQEKLHIKTKALLKSLNYEAELTFGDGFEGIESEAPFDKIIITAGAPEIPKKLFAQLNVGGIMILPLQTDNKLRIAKVKKESATTGSVELFTNCAFVPMLKGVVENNKV